MKVITNILFILLVSIATGSFGGEIHKAVKDQELEKIKTLLQANPQLIHSTDEWQRTPLHWACRINNPELVALLLASGAKPNILDVNKISPLHSAASRGNIEAVELLLEHGAEMDVAGLSGNMPLHYAAWNGQTAMVALLLENGACLDCLNERNRTPLLIAAREEGGVDVVRVLLDAGANVNAVDLYGDTPLTLAAWRRNETVVDCLLEHGAAVPDTGQKSADIIKFALEGGLWHLYESIKQQNEDFDTLLPSGILPLQMASKGGSVKIVSDLIDSGCKVNAKDIYGYTPLHYAARNGRLEVAKILVKHGADVNSYNKLMETPYQLADNEGKETVMKFLVSAGYEPAIRKNTTLSGPYFGQELPGELPVLFAPGIVSTPIGGHSNVVFTKNGDEAFWTEWNDTDQGYADGSRIWHSRIVDGTWTVPEIFRKYGDTPAMSADGSEVFYLDIVRSEDNRASERQIKYFPLKGENRLETNPLGFDITQAGFYWQFTLDDEQNIYFGGREGLHRSRFVDGRYQEPEKLTEVFHPDYRGECPFIAADGSYIIFASQHLPDLVGEIDLFIGFRKPDGRWSEPINMGPTINTPEIELLPMVSRDGAAFFFRSTRDHLMGIYWVSTDVIEDLRRRVD
jgi:ankyrin repeat protein